MPPAGPARALPPSAPPRWRSALAIALVVRVFFYQPFNIPSGSMKDTLLVGDYLFVSKLSYGYSRYSFPFGVNLFVCGGFVAFFRNFFSKFDFCIQLFINQPPNYKY